MGFVPNTVNDTYLIANRAQGTTSLTRVGYMGTLQGEHVPNGKE